MRACDQSLPLSSSPARYGSTSERSRLEQSHAGPPGRAGALRPLVAQPDRQRLLRRTRCDLAAGEQPPHFQRDPIGLVEAAGHVDAERVVLRLRIAGAEPELEPALGDQVDHRGFFGEMAGMAKGRKDDGGAEPHALRPRGHAAASTRRLREVAVGKAVMLGEPDRPAPQALRPGQQLQGAAHVSCG